MPTVIELDFSGADQRLVALRERADRLHGRAMSIRRGIFDLEQRRAEMAASNAARARLAEQRHARERPQLPPLPAGLDPDSQDRLLRQFGQVLEAARSQPETALEDDVAALAKLDRTIAAEEEAFTAIGSVAARALAASCETWLRHRHGTSDPRPFVVAVDPELPDDLDALRAMLPGLAAEARAIEAAPATLAEAQAKLAVTIREAVARPGLALGPFIDPNASGVLMSATMPMPNSSLGVWTALAQIAPDAVHAHAERALTSHYAALPKDAPITLADRAAMLDKIEARRRSIELAEELLIRAAGDDGEARRRSDVRPEFALGEWEDR